jgi:cell division septation protein DedD
MAHSDDGQYELVLENKQVLGIFFVAVILCGIFFGLGFLVGRSSKGPTGAQPLVTSTSTGADNRKSAMPAEKPLTPAPTPGDSAEKPAETQPAAEKPADPQPPAAEKEKPKPEEKAPSPAPTPAAAPPAETGAVNLQVAAFSTRDEAEPVAALLKRKNFPVSIVAGATDKLQHVLVGPYPNVKEADAVKKRLESEGFKPIVKK